MSFKKLSIVIPVYNEESTILLILQKIKSVHLLENLQKEIIIVNDFSRDNSDAIISEFISNNPELEIKYFQHQKNQGKGASVRTAVKEATGEYLIIQDADLEYDPNDYNAMITPILSGKADVVYGSRFMNGTPHRVLFFWHTFANKFITSLSNIATNLSLTDVETCYKLFETKTIQNIRLSENKFGFDPEVTAKISRIPNIKIYEVGISYFGRTYQQGKKIGWKDGVRAIYCIIKYAVFKMN
ncbi:glycosyltransferase family 2 protein [Tenacibaculum sp. 190524A05c]|uniref:Glycosyltransferase involved in cell wall biosynthesis n=1 Tax=Tenacibaculum platacis TaxID=3137852 RepID=A0ABM9P4D1_9FLAO